MTPPDQQVDHAEKARRWVDHAERRGSDDVSAITVRTAFAQVHATLALHEELERLGERLDLAIRRSSH